MGAQGQPRLDIADIQRLTPAQKFDCMWAFSVLIHISDDTLARTLDFAGKHPAAGGVFYANVNTAGKKDAAWGEVPRVWRPMKFHRLMCAQNGLAARDLGRLNNLGKAASARNQRMLKIMRH